MSHLRIRIGDKEVASIGDAIAAFGKANIRFVQGYPVELAKLDTCLCGLDIEKMGDILGYAVHREPGMLFVLTKEG